MFRKALLLTSCIAALFIYKISYSKESNNTDYKYTTVHSTTLTHYSKVNIKEFFWYSCPHCYHIDALIDKLEQNKKYKNIRVERIAAALEDNMYWNKMAKVFYTLKAMGKLYPTMHKDIFAALHRDGINIYNPKILKAFIENHNISWDDFEATYNSFSVSSDINRSIKLMNQFNIMSVPTVMIQDKYIVDPSMGKSIDKFFETILFLIDKAEKELK